MVDPLVVAGGWDSAVEGIVVGIRLDDPGSLKPEMVPIRPLLHRLL